MQKLLVAFVCLQIFGFAIGRQLQFMDHNSVHEGFFGKGNKLNLIEINK